MTQPAETTPNPVLDALAKIHLSLTAVDKKLTGEAARMAELNRAYLPLYIGLTGVTTSQTVDLPNILGPRTGWYWDIHTIIGQGVSAGSITVYKNSANGEQWATFNSSGQVNWGKLQFLLTAGDRLVLVGSASLPATGAAITVAGVQIAAPRFGRYVE